MKKSLIATVAAFALQGMLTFAPLQAAQAASLSLALDNTPDREAAGTFRWADTFEKSLKAQGWDTETFPRDSIGGENERMDQVQSGILDVSMSNLGKAVQLNPELRVIQLPYTFSDIAHEQRFFTESDFLDQINATLADHDVRILAVVPNGGFLGIFNTKQAVHSVSDMKGLRMRALDQSQLTMFDMMGASGVVIPWAEVPNAIQTGIADGYVNPAGVPLTFGQTSLFKHYSDAKVTISARMAIASTQWWDGLSDDEKAQVNKAVAEANTDVFSWAAAIDQSHMAQLTKEGIAVYQPTPAEIATFREATAAMKTNVPDVDQARVDEILSLVERYQAQ
jgi:TRAP-type C4-dicarboxylate transport system substrate-binding protein